MEEDVSEDDRVCYSPTLTLAWLFLAASVLTTGAALYHGDYGALWQPAVLGPLASAHILLRRRDRRR